MQFQASPISSGPSGSAGQFFCDYWTQTTQLTLEFCIEPADGHLFPTGVPLLGIGVNPDEPSPFLVSIWDDPNKVQVVFRTSDVGVGYNLPNRSFAFSLIGSTAPYRVAVQIDLVNAACSAFREWDSGGFGGNFKSHSNVVSGIRAELWIGLHTESVLSVYDRCG